MIDEDEDDEDDDFPLLFHEPLGEHALNDDVRGAIVWASIQKFLAGTPMMDEVDYGEFIEKERTLSKSVVFHGPFRDFEEAVLLAQKRQGVVVAPRHEWTEEEQPVWLACLAS